MKGSRIPYSHRRFTCRSRERPERPGLPTADVGGSARKAAISGISEFPGLRLGIAFLAVFAGTVGGAQPAARAAAILRPAPVDIGSASNFAVLAGATVTNAGASHIDGDLGVSPGTAVTGFPPGVLAGTMHNGDPIAFQAKSDMDLAYNDAATRTPTSFVSGDLGGRTLTPGVYSSLSSIGVAGELTLDGQGHPNAVFIFQMATTFITGASARITLAGGAQACNVFWQVGSSATLGANSAIVGNIVADQSITVGAGTAIDGRALARDAAVTLDTNAIASAECDPPGTLDISVPTGPVSLGTASVAAANVSGNLGIVTVSDNRDVDPAEWIATVSCTNFGLGIHMISASNVSYTPGIPIVTGDPILEATAVTNLSAAQEVVQATDGTGLNTAAWDPTVTVAIPTSGALAGTYAASFTHSVA